MDLFSVDFDIRYDYEEEWRKFAWEQGKVEASVAIEFYKENKEIFINGDIMEEYVRELADETGVDDISSFYMQKCKIYMDNPYFDEDEVRARRLKLWSGV